MMQLAALAIIAVTIGLSLGRPRLGRFRIDHAAGALIGAALVVLLGVAPPRVLVDAARFLAAPLLTIVSLMLMTQVGRTGRPLRDRRRLSGAAGPRQRTAALRLHLRGRHPGRHALHQRRRGPDFHPDRLHPGGPHRQGLAAREQAALLLRGALRGQPGGRAGASPIRSTWWWPACSTSPSSSSPPGWPCRRWPAWWSASRAAALLPQGHPASLRPSWPARKNGWPPRALQLFCVFILVLDPVRLFRGKADRRAHRAGGGRRRGRAADSATRSWAASWGR